ncbi:MAG: hypothetical protein P8X73_12910 [Ignavibacteriaceae bacterium]
MIPELRKKFNSEFNEETYQKFVHELNSTLRYPAGFRIAETPLFLSKEFQSELITACDPLLKQIRTDDFKKKSQNALPANLSVPNEDDHPQFLQIDFAICKDNGSFIPQLIELQGFPTVYGYQCYLSRLTKKYFNIDNELSPYFNSFDEESYIQNLKDIIIGDCDTENVVLLEIQPEKQKTRIDFAATEKLLGVSEVCITDVVQEGRKLYYKKNGKLVPIDRVYNRVIFDELERDNIEYNFNFNDDLILKWIPHPNWFFKISKYSLPMLRSKYVPDCFFLNELKDYPDDLQNYVLKPLFSFAGHGVEIDLTLIETPDEQSKVEIRLMFLWDKEPLLVNNLVRLSKGKMMGVDYNKNKTWVGSSLALHY